jgi:N-acetylglucosaminyl-diphospho-decaprenol L-rhamnosyltransferase
MADPRSAERDLSVVVLTFDEEQHLADCLASALALTPNVLVLDSGSQDRTVQIAAKRGVRVERRRFDGYASQRSAALDMVETEWVLFLDADERIPPALGAEIRHVVETAGADVAGACAPRRNLFWGRELRGGGWWPDHQTRLLRRTCARYRHERQVHEIVDLNGRLVTLSTPIVHLNYESFAEFRHKQSQYAALRVKEMAAAGVPARRQSLIGQPAREFWRRLVRLGGYRDGRTGFLLAASMAWYEFQVWRAMLHENRVVARARRDSHEPHSASVNLAVTLAEEVPTLDISIIIVSYNVRDHLLNCLASIEASLTASKRTGEVIVVDNGSTDGTPALIRRRFPDVRVITNSENRGFAAANNQGIREARGHYIALLNPDTLARGDAFGVLARYLDEHPAVGVIGPRLIRPDGATQSSRRRFPSRLTGFLESTLVQEYWRTNRVLRRYYMSDRPDSEEQAVDWLVGACLLARREAIEDAGLLDERFFMYSEEVEWCHRLKHSGWKVMYVPQACVVHLEGASSAQNVPARQINFDRSKVMLYERLHGRWLARTLHAFLLGTYLARIGIESSKGLIGHNRALRWQRVSMYYRVLRARMRESLGR